MSLKNPKVTVLLPVYNGEKYLHDAVKSILNQTFTDFEFLIINDGSTDNSIKIIKSFNDERIHLINNNKNLKLAKTLNKGIDLAQGKYIVRMDQDDISYSERLSKQVDFMEKHPEVGVCGSWVKLIGKNAGQIWDIPPSNSDIIKCLLLFSSYIFHPTVIIRKNLLKKYNLYYNPAFLHAEDYDLWCRISEYSQISNLQEILLYYRIHSEKMSDIYNNTQIQIADLIRKRQIKKLGIDPNYEEFKIHKAISLWNFNSSKKFLMRIENWLIKLKDFNRKKLAYPEPAFSQVLSKKWYDACSFSTELGLFTWNNFCSSPLGGYFSIDFKEKVKFFIKCILGWGKK